MLIVMLIVTLTAVDVKPRDAATFSYPPPPLAWRAGLLAAARAAPAVSAHLSICRKKTSYKSGDPSTSSCRFRSRSRSLGKFLRY